MSAIVNKKTAPQKRLLDKALVRAPNGSPKPRYGNVARWPNPAPSEIKALRSGAGLTKLQAAEILKSTLSTYAKWEGGHRPMHPCFWEFFQLKANSAPATSRKKTISQQN